MIKSKEYYEKAYKDKWNSLYKENPDGAGERFENEATPDETAGFYLVLHEKNALHAFTVDTDGIKKSMQDMQVELILRTLAEREQQKDIDELAKQNNIPAFRMPERKYYDESLDINATADELYIQVRNGYRSDVNEIERIAEILKGENKGLQARYCEFEIEAIQETIQGKDADYNFARIKQDVLYNEIHGNSTGRMLYVEFPYDDSGNTGIIEQNPDGDFLVAVHAGDNSNAAFFKCDEFLAMNRKEFESMINELDFYMERFEPDDMEM